MPGSNNGEERGPSLYEQLMRATARDDASTVRGLIDQARDKGPLDDNLLRLGLQNCAKKGLAETARVLLENGARTDITPGAKGSPALFWAVSQPQNKGHLQVAKLLLESKGRYAGCPADKNWCDETGRNLVMSAASRNHHDALQLLLDAGADINARDLEKRTVLHSLAAEKKGKGKWDDRIVSIILDRPIDVNARDRRNRTALHWACATGKTTLVQQLISRARYEKPDLDLTTSRGKTAMQLACSTEEAVPEIVRLLLDAKADPTIRSDGGWTCLHVSAVIQGSLAIVELLLGYCPSLLNFKTSTGLTALHCAAEAGSEEVVQLLLSLPDIQLNAKDAFHTTPLLRAAQKGHHKIVAQLAPFNNVNRLSHYAADACNGFEATVVDFRGAASDHQNIVQKRTVAEVLYGKEADGEHSVTTRVDKIRSRTKQGAGSQEKNSKPRFRWIHLPANNLAWVEALIAKSFIEGDCSDLEGFKAIERGFSHQHRGPKSHSQFMTPLCLRSARGASATDKLPLYGPLEDAIKGSAGRPRHDYQSSPERAGRSVFQRHGRIRGGAQDRTEPRLWEDSSPIVEAPSVHAQMTAHGALRALTEEPENTASASADGDNRPSPSTDVNSGAKKGKGDPRKKKPRPKVQQAKAGAEEDKGEIEETSSATTAPPQVQTPSRMNSNAPSELSTTSQRSKNKETPLTGSNIVLFMPYLHWETDDKRRRMKDAISQAKAEGLTSSVRQPMCHDETLIRAHLGSSLHLRRTIDQFYLHGIDTDERDGDQVVYRYCRDNNRVEKVYMVDQLWMWILGPSLIVTAFPQRWQQPKNDPLNVLDGIIEDVNSRTGTAVQSVYDLALLITARTSGSFDRHRPGDEDYQFLDMFESSIGNVNNKETALYREFYKASETVHTWLSTHREDSADHSYPPVVDAFLDIGKETKLLQEIKDIRDELNMISMVLNNQKSTLPALNDAIAEDLNEGRGPNYRSRDVRRRLDEQRRTVDMHLAELDRMAVLSRGIETSLLNLLDLKQKQSNAFEARFARDQAAGTVRQGQIIMVFTMVTIIFLPMSFMAAFFTIPVAEFPRSPKSGTPLMGAGYVSKYIFGIGLGMSVVLITLAFSINPLGALTKHMSLSGPRKWWGAGEESGRELGSLETLKVGGRWSVDTGRSGIAMMEVELEEVKRQRLSLASSRRFVYRNDLERGG